MASTNQSDIQLRIVALIDGLVEIAKLTSEVDALGGQTAESSGKVEQLVTELDRLRKQDQLIDQFQTLKRETSGLSGTLDDARARATSLGKGLSDSKKAVAESNSEYKASKTATQALADEWRLAKLQVDQLAKGIKESNAPTKEQRAELKAARAEAKQLGDQYRESARTTAELASGLSSAEKALKQQTREFNAARKEVNLLDSQYIKQSGTLNGLRTQLQQSGLNTKQLAAEQRALKEATSNAEQEAKKLAAELREQADDQKWLNEQLNAGERELKQYEAAAKQAWGSTKALGDEADSSANSFYGWAKGIAAAAVAFLSIDRAKDAIVELVSTASDMDIMQANAKRAGLEFSALSQFAADTSLQLTEVMDVAIKTKNYGLDPMSGALQAATDAAAASGKGYEQVDGILSALGQAYTKTKLQQEEMNQLAERGIPAWTLLSEATGKSIPELQGMASAGKLGRAEIELLIKAIGSEYAGAAKAAMNNTKGLASNLGDEFTKAKDAVASAGLMDFVNDQLREVTGYIQQLRQDGTLTEWGRDIASTMQAIGDYTKYAVSAIKLIAPELKVLAQAWVGLKIVKWLSDLKSLSSGFKSLSIESGESAKSITKSVLASDLAAASFGKLNPIVRASSGLIGTLKAGLIGLGASWGIEKILEAVDAYRQMRDAQDAAEKSQQVAISTGRQLKDKLAEISKEVGITITNLDQFDKLLADGAIHLDAASGLYKRGVEGIKNLGAAASEAAPKATKFYDNLEALRGKLTELKPSSDEAAKVVTDMFGEMEAGSRKSVSFIISQLTEMEKKGEITGKALDSGVGAAIRNLSSKELNQLQKILAEVGQRMDDVGNKARSTGDKLNTELFRRIGVDLQEMRTGFTEAGIHTIDVFGQIATSGKNSSSEIKAAFVKAIDSAATKKEADQLISIYQAAGRSGAVSMQDIQAGMDRSIGKTKELTASTGSLGAAYSDLDLLSAEALNNLAARHKASFDEITRSGASLDIQRQAFLAYAEAELKAAQASDRYADGALSATAASLGLSKEFAALQQSTASVGSEALITAGALDTLSGSADNAAASMSNAAKRSKELQDASTSAAEGAGAASAFMSDYTTNLQKSLRELSPQAEHMMTNMLGISSSTASASSAIDTLTQKLDANYAQWKRISMSVTLDDIQGRIKEVGEAYLMSERAYLQQAIAAEQMKEQLSSANGVTAQTIKYAESLANGMDMLDAQTLSGLRSAIDSAREKMQSLESSAKSTLNSLRDELDQYNNNLDAVEQRRYESQIADIQAKLDEAQAMKDQTAVRDYQEALDLANKLHQKKMQDIADEAAAAKKNQQSNVATDTTLTNTVTTQSAATQAATPTEVIQINLPNGSTATVSADKTNSTALKDILQQLQLHALRS